jgi:predicted metal-dependent hydrolase
MATPPGTVLQGGRPKAYRPIPETARREAFLSAIRAYERGDFFLAHELLEPAWMGTDDIAERELYQGLIKLAAAFVHGVRGNPRGVGKNLEGARDRLVAARDAGVDGRLDLDHLIAAIDARMTDARPSDVEVIPPPLLWRTQS